MEKEQYEVPVDGMDDIPVPTPEAEQTPFLKHKEGVLNSLKEGRIDKTEAATRLLSIQKGEDFFGMSPQQVKAAHKLGVVSLDEAKMWARENREMSPQDYLDDACRGVFAVAPSMVKETIIGAADLANKLAYDHLYNPIVSAFGRPDLQVQTSARESWDFFADKVEEYTPKVVNDAAEDLFVPKSAVGDFVKNAGVAVASMYGINKTSGMVAFSRITEGALMAAGLKNVKRGTETAKWIAEYASLTTSGAVGSYLTFNPYEGNIANAVRELGVEGEVVDYLAANPNDSEAEARLKNAVGDVASGLVFDTLLKGLKGVKAWTWDQHKVPEKVASFVHENLLAKIPDAKERVGKKWAESLEARKRLKAEREMKELEAKAKEAEAKSDPDSANLHSKITEMKAEKEVEVPANFGTGLDEYQKKVGALRSYAEVSELRKKGDELTMLAERHAKKTYDDALSQGLNPREAKLKAEATFRVLHKKLKGTLRTFSAPPESFQPYAEFLDKVANEDVYDLLNAVGRGTDEYQTLTKARGEKLDLANVEGNADAYLKKLSKLTGGSKEMLRDMFELKGTMEDVPQRLANTVNFFLTYADAVSRAVDRARSTGGKAERILVMRHLDRLAELQAGMMSIRANTGRSLNVFKLLQRQPVQRLNLEALDEGMMDDILDSFAKAKSAEKQMKYVRKLGQSTFVKAINQLQQGGLLTNPTTWLVNLVGNGVSQSIDVSGKMLACTAKSIGAKDPRYFKAMQAYGYGTMLGFRDSLRLTRNADGEVGRVWKALWTGRPQIDNVQTLGEKGFGVGIWDEFGEKIGNKTGLISEPIMGEKLHLGKLLTFQFHFLTAGDELAKNLNHSGTLHFNLAWEGVEKGLKGKELADYVKLRAADPTDADLALARGGMLENTFQDELGEGAGAVEKFLNTTELGGWAKFMACPFYKILINMFKYAPRRIVGGVGEMVTNGHVPRYLRSSQMHAKYMQGGRARLEMVGQTMTALSLLGSGIYLAQTGAITGATPKDMRGTESMAGRQAYSFDNDKLPEPMRNALGLPKGEFTSYGKLEPLASFLALGATVSDFMDNYEMSEDDTASLIADSVLSILQSTSDRQPLLEEAATSMQIMMGDERANYQRFFAEKANNLIPWTALRGRLNRAGDDTIRRPYDFEDFLKPYRKLQPKRHSLYGTIVRRTGERLHGLSIGRVKDYTNDPVMQELMRVKLNVYAPSKYIADGFGERLKLNSDEYAYYNDLIAELNPQEKLTKFIESKEYQECGSDRMKADKLNGLIDKIRSAARDKFKASDAPTAKKYRASQFLEMAKANHNDAEVAEWKAFLDSME